MHFLSVASRELRVASRKRGAYRLRLFASGLALFLSAFSLWFVTLFDSRPVSGAQLFEILSWAAFIFACLAGPALTADCVNEERNTGTLGLLFLSNLPALAISLGKLFGQGLLALYSIVSIIPVMALPVLLGGADAESLAKTAVVLVVTLTTSLVVGMFYSTVCRKPFGAAAFSLLTLAIMVVGIPVVSLILRLNSLPGWADILEPLSPAYALSMASPGAVRLSSNQLWLSLGIQSLITLLLFGVITALLPRVWQEGRSSLKNASLRSKWRAILYGSGETRRRLRIRLLGINPYLWLSARQRFGPLGHGLIFLGAAGAIAFTAKELRIGPPPHNAFLGQMAGWIAGLPLLYVAFCFRLAAAASERFAVDRKSGALELILCTPISPAEIIRGRWLGLLRRFWAAALVLLALHAFTLNYIIEAIRIIEPVPGFGWPEVLLKPLRHIFIERTIDNLLAPFYIACLAVFSAAVLIVILWIALGWLGMAFSLKLKREILAPWLAFLLLAVPPVPIFIGSVYLLDDKQLFSSNLFLALLRVGFTGFSIVMANALLWLWIARRWVFEQLGRNHSV